MAPDRFVSKPGRHAKDSRNSLIHEGRFAEPKLEDWELLSFREEGEDETGSTWQSADSEIACFFFMVNFMDRFFMSFFNYKGNYMNQKINLKHGRIGNFDTTK